MTKKIRLAWFRWWMKPIYTNIPRSNFESVRPSSKLLQSLRRFSNKTRLMSISNASIRFKTGHNCEVSLSSFFWRFQPNFSGFIFAKEKTEMKRGKMAKNVSARFFFIRRGNWDWQENEENTFLRGANGESFQQSINYQGSISFSPSRSVRFLCPRNGPFPHKRSVTIISELS